MFSNVCDRLENCLIVLDEVFEEAAKGDARTIVFCGDMFHTFSQIATTAVNNTILRFRKLFKDYPDITFYAISGNHDHAVLNSWKSPSDTSLRWLATAFPKRFIVLDNRGIMVDGIAFYGIPYYKHTVDFDLALAQAHAWAGAQAGVPKVLLIHQSPQGLANKFIQPDILNDNAMFAAFDQIYCGHIHQTQQVRENFLVVGSPLQADAGDFGDDKGIFLVDCQPVTKKLKKSLGFEFKSTYICLRNHPRFETVATAAAQSLGTFFEVRGKTVAKSGSVPKALTDSALIDAYLQGSGLENTDLVRKIGLSILESVK